MKEVALYYWPRLIVSVLFTLFSLRIIKDKYTKLQQLLLGIFLFCISGPIVSITAELFSFNTFNSILTPFLNYDDITVTGIFVVYNIVIDLLFILIPIILYAKILDERIVVAATMYFQYVLQDRFALTLSRNAVEYLIIYFVALVFLALMHAKDMEYIATHVESLSWKPVLHYNFTLFILIDTCYSAYYFIEELQYDTLNIVVIWLDAIIIISCFFAAGFSKLNIHLSRAQDNKLEYLQKFQDSQTDIIREFASISEAKSGETGEHIRRVSEYTAILASYFFTEESDINTIKIASMMHDIGKLMIPNEIIEKKGKLTPDEYDIIKTHSAYGNKLLSQSSGELMNIAQTIAYEHHERWDGLGYPRGLCDNEISIYAQIVSVADVYDALTSRRSYKEPWPPEAAKAEILRQKGSQFSPKVVDAFEKSYDKIEEIRVKYAD